jgi:hypothetical protein
MNNFLGIRINIFYRDSLRGYWSWMQLNFMGSIGIGIWLFWLKETGRFTLATRDKVSFKCDIVENCSRWLLGRLMPSGGWD